jgi:cytochrome c551/c552
VYVKVDYLSGPDRAQVVGHQVITAAMEGKNLAATLDCKACHKEAEKSIGPAYAAIATKYEKDPKAKSYLTNKIIKGGGGVWGETAMAAHPDLKPSDAEMIVDWILGLNKQAAPSLPEKGSITPTDKDMGRSNMMQITATYTDRGGAGLRPQSGVGVLTLRAPLLSVEAANARTGITMGEMGGNKVAMINGAAGTLSFELPGLKYVNSVELAYQLPAAPMSGYVISLFANSVDGVKLGETTIGKDTDLKVKSVKVPLQQVPAGPFKLVVRMEKLDKAESRQLGLSSLKWSAAK